MPAAAVRKRHSGTVTEDHVRAPHRRLAPGARPLPRPVGARSRSSAVAAPLYQPGPVTAEPLPVTLPDYETETVLDEARERARAASRRARRAHQPLQCSWSTGLGITVVLCQLVALLWLQGLALSARNRSVTLDKKIQAVQEGLSRTQKEIAALDSSPQLAGWAQARGWSLATQDQLDPVTADAVSWQPTAVAPAATDAPTPPGNAAHAQALQADVNVDNSRERVAKSNSKARHHKQRDKAHTEATVP